MKIDFFVPSCTPSNSHGRYVIELSTRFARAHDVVLHSGAFWPPLRGLMRCRQLPVPNRPAAVRLFTLWSAAFLHSARRRQSDIIHIQGADAPNGNVVTAHYCNAAVPRAAGPSPSWNERLNRAIGSMAEHYCYSKPSTRVVIAVCGKVKDEIQDYYGIAPERVVVVPLGVDTLEFNPATRPTLRASVRRSIGIHESDFAICFVGADYRRKGLVTLLKAVHRVEGSPHIIGVGVRPDVALREAVTNLGLDERVHFTEVTEDPAAYYAASDCFALLTRYDNFSLATLEAMASGLPVIVTAAAGISEYLTDGIDALLIRSSEDVDAITEAVQRLSEDQTLRLGFGARARKTAEAYSWDTVAERTLAAYKLAL